jgi:hypothetical protein
MRRKRPTEREAQGLLISEELMMMTGMKEWRQQHPRATLREMEEAIDERLAKVRAGMLEEAVKMSSQADWSQAPKARRPRCEQCGTLEVEPRQTESVAANQWRPAGPVGTHLWNLPAMRPGAFSPWTRKWNWMRVI